jgi:uroporphyrinogen decarboxylase
LILSGPFLEVFGGKAVSPPPLWMMRQAGRYLPEYRETRAKAGSFWNLCNTPELAAEVTLQPMRRFGFDAAIIFSDILVIATALGHAVVFDEGPKLEPLQSAEKLDRSEENWTQKLTPVYEAIGLVRSRLEADKALLGFAGAPWTIATYLAGGGKDVNQLAAKFWSYRNPNTFQALIDLLTDCVAHHLIGQLKAGADAVQIFDSWAAGLPPVVFERWVIKPTAKVVEKVRSAVPGARIIGFPRAASLVGLERYVEATGVDVISLDQSVPLGWAVEQLGKKVVLQGNLDPLALVVGKRALREGVDGIIMATRGQRFIFNLGHGVLPGTPVENVSLLAEMVRGVG